MTTADGPPPAPQQDDNLDEHPHGATVTETGRPVVVSRTFALCPDRAAPEADGLGYVPRTAAEVAATGGFHDPDAGTKWAGLFDSRDEIHGPRLRCGSLAALAVSGRGDRKWCNPAPLSPEGQRIADRKARKAARRAAEGDDTTARRKPRGRRSGMSGLIDALKAA
jgi:hypothetical protein